MRSFQCMALTLAGLIDPAIAIAASRAGAIGVLNLEHVQNITKARSAIMQMAQFATNPCGIKLDSHELDLIDLLTTDLPTQVSIIYLTPWQTLYSTDDQRTCAGLSPLIERLRKQGLNIFLEVTNLTQAQNAQQAGADGLIAKGHEAGGWVGEETTFILLQHLLSTCHTPVWAYGGIGLHTAPACYAAGAAGVVLDAQLALTRESHLPEAVKKAIATMDGSETLCLGSDLGQPFRVYQRPDAAAAQSLTVTALDLSRNQVSSQSERAWRQAVKNKVGWGSLQENIWPLGQDICFAKALADQYCTVGGIIGAIQKTLATHPQTACELRPLAMDSPLAQSHGTRYPIVQGPMTRVSDRAEFALRVAEGGGLPFLALALMRAPEVEALLSETQQRLGAQPWGVGILGFVPLALRQEQLAVIQKFTPTCALIAGGRPDQALALEKNGIPTYLHVPSPGLLRLFLQEGARRFVFEGRECGGHVGPRSSFVLWNSMVDVLLDELPANAAAECHLLFAGGIHDRISAAMVATLAAPLAAREVRIGVLMGTAYLFTEEVVASGGVVASFQEEALRCQNTVLLESGSGHATRCIPTPFVELFAQEKQRLQQAGKSPEEIRSALEELNLGRLRIAAKGITRHPRYGQAVDAPKHAAVDAEAQRREGMYMIGQVAALREQLYTIAALHEEVSVGSTEYLAHFNALHKSGLAQIEAQPSQIAIIGISTLLPKAKNRQEFWANILNKVNAVTEVPEDRWDAGLYFDSDRHATDKIYSKAGGFLDDIPFDPIEFGIPPNSLSSIDPMHLLALLAARNALADAGYAKRPFDRSRSSVILGASGGTGDLGASYLLRSGLPLLFGKAGFEIAAQAGEALPVWTEDSFAGLLLNVAAGRIANRFDFGGLNYVVDAACASSLTAVHLAVKELETHNTDLVIAGGVDTVQTPFGYLCFSKTQALSPSGQPRVFDATGDGIVISEGVVMLVLKRLADAERDGDRIYAVIAAVGGSSDGRAMGMTAPRPEGQARALERAYAKAGFSPTTVELFEAHGTGTVVGDRTEARSLASFLTSHGAELQNHAIGSIKSMIGHTKATAGVTGIAKMALALYHKVLPPTLGVTQPNPKAGFGEGPLYVNTEVRPWISRPQTHPRRAGVSAFGFGGTNFHAVLEEYTRDFLAEQGVPNLQTWPSELFLWSACSVQALLASVALLTQAIDHGAAPTLRDLAYTLWHQFDTQFDRQVRLAIVAESIADLRQKLAWASTSLTTQNHQSIQDPRGVYFTTEPLRGEVAFLFPGQGSQYPNMLRDLAIHFPQVRETFEQTDRVLLQQFPKPLSRYIFPPPVFSPDEEREQQKALMQTNVAQPALGAANMAIAHVLHLFGVEPTLIAGHSYGEYAALCAANVIDLATLAILSEARGRSILEAASDDLGAMVAVWADSPTIMPLIKPLEQIWLANLNAPNQTILSGTKESMAKALALLQAVGINARSLPVACAFHSPLMAPAQKRLADVLAHTDLAVPSKPVFSNTTAAPYPHAPESIRALLADHLLQPVRFAEQITAMYAAGARIFVEVGPGSVLTNLVGQILATPHLAVAIDQPRRNGLTHLQQALGQLAVHDVALQLGPLFERREAQLLNLDTLKPEAKEAPLSPTTWLVNGSRVRPASVPKQVLHPSPLSFPTLPVTQTNSNGKGSEPAPKSLNPIASPVPTPLNGSPSVQSAQVMSPIPRSAPSPTPLGSVPVDLPSNGAAEQVMLQFQQSMANFLETQRRVMLTYLYGADGSKAGAATMATTASSPLIPPPPFSGEAGQALHPETPTLPALTTSIFTNNQHPSDPVIALQPNVNGSIEIDSLLNKEQLTAQLLQIVSERTGYPPALLDLDVDMEANLGIDSIKRVEILGLLQRNCVPANGQLIQSSMEELAGIRTLRGIVHWLMVALHGKGSDDPEAATVDSDGQLARPRPASINSVPATLSEQVPGDIPRSRFTAVPVASVKEKQLYFRDAPVFLITDDGSDIAIPLAYQLHEQGGRAILVRLQEFPCADVPTFHADLTDPTAVAAVVNRIRSEHGPIAGIIHLLPMRNQINLAMLDLGAWQAALRRDIKSLFYLVQAVADDIKQATAHGNAWVISATNWGNHDAQNLAPASVNWPGAGGIGGLLKTLATEWPAVNCKVVHMDLANTPATLANQLLAEILANDRLAEVGYDGATRYTLQPALAPLAVNGPPHLAITAESILLLTGGARGITAEVACYLAERYQPTLLLVGSSPLPPLREAPQTAGLTEPQAIKAALIDAMRQADEAIALAQVEALYKYLLKEREIRMNVERMQRAGAKVHYYQVDVRDEQAMGQLLADLYQQYGRIDGVIHGAGIVEDKRIEEKTGESFDRVFSTKVDSAFILSQALRPESLQFLAFFTSAAGAFGNRGQSDYASANAVLNKLAVYLDAHWRGRVFAVNWGPWLKTGMVSAALQQAFIKRQIQLIAIPQGCDLFERELQYGQKGEAEVILAAGTWNPSPGHESRNGRGTWLRSTSDTGSNTNTGSSTLGREPLPLLHQALFKNSANEYGQIEMMRFLDPSEDRYLADHQLDNKAVFPVAMAIELMAETVQQGWPEFEVVGLRDLRVLRGIVLENGPKRVRVVARASELEQAGQKCYAVSTEILDATSGHSHYQAIVELAATLPRPPQYVLPLVDNLQPLGMTIAEAYQRWLFHGPIFQGIEEVEGISPHTLVATCLPSSPQQCLAKVCGGEWLIDPVIFDSALQGIILWTRKYLGTTPLPSSFRRYRRFNSLSMSKVHCYLQFPMQLPQNQIFYVDIAFVSPNGRLLGLLEGMECPTSKALNRLAGQRMSL